MRRVRSGLYAVLNINKDDNPKELCDRVTRWIPKNSHISECVKVSLVDFSGEMSLVIDDTCLYSDIST